MPITHEIYRVVRGDTLSEIGSKYLPKYPELGNTATEAANTIAKKNNIKNQDLIYVGQDLIISGDNKTPNEDKSYSCAIEHFGLQANTDRTVFATWNWSKDNTENYQVKWTYDTGDGVSFIGNDGTTEDTQSIYNAPSNAISVAFKVKPISKKKTVNKKETSYWTADWSTVKKYYFKDNPPSTPSVPSVEIKDYKLTATLDNLNVNGDTIEFQVVKDNSTVFNTGKSKIVTSHASYSCMVTAGGEYKVRCRALRGDLKSDWTEYTENTGTSPSASSGIVSLKALSETSVYIDWEKVSNAESYEIQYTTQKGYFDSSNEVQSMTVESLVGHAEVTGLETGKEWFFRVRAVNTNGNSAWTEIKSIRVGKAPSAPTTWSSTTTCVTGEALTLYWVHNSEDGSAQTYADIELYINGVKETHTIRSVDEPDDEKTMHYAINTSEYVEGTTIKWRVRTAGVTNTYSEWSTQRTVDIYSPAVLSISVTNSSGTALETLTSFPFYISGVAGPNTQKPIGYHISITADSGYETIDNVGNFKMVSAGDEVYSKYYDTSEDLLVELSAGSIDLENNINYTVKVTVSMDSGLTAEASSSFTVSWTDDMYTPNAEVGIDMDTLTAYIRPYCVDKTGTAIPGILLSVYRREFDGSFTELVTGLDNTKNTYITDPHPSLDYARYRVVAIDSDTGAVSYYDLPGYPVGETSIIIQWDEQWTNFETTTEDALEQPPWSGSMLKLPYNIDVTDDYSPDVSLIKYIGREHPVSYYGTHIGETSKWDTEIPKDDKETLYAIRRLAIWRGDAYVREPSGSGYWANINVSFSQKHLDLTIPVTLSITRVSGGA